MVGYWSWSATGTGQALEQSSMDRYDESRCPVGAIKHGCSPMRDMILVAV